MNLNQFRGCFKFIWYSVVGKKYFSECYDQMELYNY